MKTYGVILAAGDSTRFDAEVNKLFYKVNGKELVLYPVETFLDNNEIDEVLIVSSESNKSVLEKILNEHQNVSIILGGDSRQESEYCALQYLQDKASEIGFEFDWTSENAMSKSRSMFRSVQSLATEFIKQQSKQK